MTQWNEIYKKEPSKYKYYDLSTPHEDMLKISKLLKSRKLKKVLDLGCGSGRNLFFLHEQGFNMSGIDLADEGIKQIKKKIGKKADLKVGNIFNKLPYADNSFDAIVSVQVLQHSTEEKIKKTISEIKRILKPSGIIFLTVSGRFSNGKIRYCLVKTAKKIGPNTYIPTAGEEKGLVHFIYNKKLLENHYKDFKIIRIWKDKKDYYSLLAEKFSLKT